jgi:prolipoprotein diacylglyceryltransferase
MMLVLEGLARFVLEMVRVEPAVWPHAGARSGLSISMILGMVNVILGVGMWWVVGRMRRNETR